MPIRRGPIILGATAAASALFSLAAAEGIAYAAAPISFCNGGVFKGRRVSG